MLSKFFFQKHEIFCSSEIKRMYFKTAGVNELNSICIVFERQTSTYMRSKKCNSGSTDSGRNSKSVPACRVKARCLLLLLSLFVFCFCFVLWGKIKLLWVIHVQHFWKVMFDEIREWSFQFNLECSGGITKTNFGW